MLVRSIVLGVAVLIAAPASAAQFFIVQDIQKQSCTIAQEPPTDERLMIVSDGAYGDEATAAADMKAMLACNPRHATSGAAGNPAPGSTKQ